MLPVQHPSGYSYTKRDDHSWKSRTLPIVRSSHKKTRGSLEESRGTVRMLEVIYRQETEHFQSINMAV
jgi:hypothetical protein